MRKIIAVFLLISTFLSLSTVNALNVINENEVENIASLMIAEQPLSSFTSLEEAKAFAASYDEMVMNQFNSLSVSEKYRVLDIIRGEKKDLSKLDFIVKSISNDLEKQNIFIWDLTDEKLATLVFNEVKDNNVYTESATSSCSLKNFPNNIYYGELPSNTSYLNAFYFEEVITSSDEIFCDTELWYYYSYSHVWATTLLSRQMITNSTLGFGGVLSTRPAGAGRLSLVIGAIRATAFMQTDISLHQNIVLWN